MLFKLISIECKEMLKSVLYYLFLICLVVFYVTQFGSFEIIEEPKPEQVNDDYNSMNYIYSDDENEIMDYTIKDLKREYYNNSFVTYPAAFYKEVKLNQKQYDRVGEILNIVEEGVSYSEFVQYMQEVDDILGGGSSYSKNRLKVNAYRPMTYEEMVNQYEGLINKDKVTRAYARLFCDYMGITLGILPVFLTAARIIKDKRNLVIDVVNSKKASSFIIYASRYISTVIMVMIPVILTAVEPAIKSMYMADILGVKGDILAYPVHIFGWLLPTVLFTLSIGFLVGEMVSGLFSILVQGVLWFFSIVLSDIMGTAGYFYIPRFNSMRDSDLFQKYLPDLINNRIFFTAISLVLFIIGYKIYDLKRRGVYFSGKIYSN